MFFFLNYIQKLKFDIQQLKQVQKIQDRQKKKIEDTRNIKAHLNEPKNKVSLKKSLHSFLIKLE